MRKRLYVQLENICRKKAISMFDRFFTRIEQDHFLVDMRTVYDDTEVDMIAVALDRIASQS